MKKYAIIVAGGSGSRMGTQVPKQFLLVQGRPVLWHTLTVFLEAYEDLEIILVLPKEYMEAGEEVLPAEGLHRIRLVTGGATRWHSVRNGLRSIGGDGETAGGDDGVAVPSVVFVHDGVRCLLTGDLVHRCYETALRLGSAIPVIDSRDSVRLLTSGGHEAVDRNRVKLVQTPQTFLSDVLLPAFMLEYRESFTDEATVVEAAGGRVYLVEGEPSNIKITTPADLAVAEQLLLQQAKRPG